MKKRKFKKVSSGRKMKKNLALGLSIVTFLSSAGNSIDSFAFTPANDATKLKITQKADEILQNQELLKHLLGTDFLAPQHNTNYTPGIDLGDYEDVDGNGKLYSKDSYILTPDQISETAWYEIYRAAHAAKNKASHLDQNGADKLLKDLNEILSIYAFEKSPKLKEDGDYNGDTNYKLVGVKLIGGDGNTNIYQKTNDEREDVKGIFSKMEIVKWGNELDLLFVANKDKVSKINYIVIKKVAGKDIKASLASSDKNNPNKNNLVAIPIPAELDGSSLVIESISYVDNGGETKLVSNPFGIDIDYSKMADTTPEENYDRFSKKTKARIKYWIKRGEILIGKYLDNDNETDKKRIAKVLDAIEKLNMLRNSDKPSMTKALEFAQPIYEIENTFTLLEVLNIKVSEALEDIEKASIINDKKYTKESIASYKSFLENTEKEAGDLDAKDIIERIYKIERATQNTLLKYNTEKLEKLIEKAEKYKESDCEEVTFSELKTNILKAKKWLEENKKYYPEYDETDECISNLEKAINGLKLKNGVTVPKAEDENSAIYEVPITDISNDKIKALLEDKAKYYETEKKFVLTFKEPTKNFVTSLTYYDADFQSKNGEIISSYGKQDSKDKIKEVAIKNLFGKNSLSTAAYINFKYYDADKMGEDELNNVSVKFDMDNKKLLSGNTSNKKKPKEEKDPYEVSLIFKNQDGNEQTYMEKTVEPTATYDPINKKLIIKARPQKNGDSITTYLTNITYQGSKVADITKKESVKVTGQSSNVDIPMEFTIDFDIEKDLDSDNKPRLIIATDAYDSAKSNKKGYDSIWLYIKSDKKKVTDKDKKEIESLLTARVENLKNDFNKVQKTLPDEIDIFDKIDKSTPWNQLTGENQKIITKKINIKSSITQSLNEYTTTIKNASLKDKKEYIKKLEIYSLAIKPWANFFGRIEDIEEDLLSMKKSNRYTSTSIAESEKIFNELKTKTSSTIAQDDIKQYTSKLNNIYSLLRLDPTKLENLIKQAEEKINSGKYKDQQVKTLKDTLYGYKQPDISYKPYYDKDTIRYKGLSNSLGAKAYLIDIKSPKRHDWSHEDTKDGTNLDISIYDSWVNRLEKGIQALQEKTASDVTTQELENKIEEAEKLSHKNSKSAEENSKLNKAIQDAKEKLKSKNQTEIDEAVKTLKNAIEIFNASKNVFNLDKLNKAIEIATNKKTNTNKEQAAIDELEKAILKAEKAKKIASQEDIDNATDELNKAIEIFEQSPDKSSSTSEETKTISVDLYKEKTNEKSMASSSLWNKAKLTKENGKYYLLVQIVPMTAENPDTHKIEVTGAITKMKYTLNNEEKFAQVLSRKKVQVGKQDVDSPTFLKLEVKENQEYVPIQLFYITYLGPSEHSPNARLKLDWNSVQNGFNDNEFKVDKGPLMDLINNYKSLTSYTKNVEGLNKTLINNLENQIKEAEKVVNDSNATSQSLENAYNNLIPIGEALRNAYEIKTIHISSCESNLNQFRKEIGKYTKESLEKYQEIIKEAKNVLKEASDYQKITDAYNKIKDIDNVLVYDTSQVESKVSEAKSKLDGNYTKDTIEILRIKITDAESWVENAKNNGIKAGYETDKHLKALDYAINSLKENQPANKKVDISSLENAIEEAKKIEKGNKKDSEFQKLKQAIIEIENSKGKIKTDAELENAKTKLQNAILEFKNSENELDKSSVLDMISQAEQAISSASGKSPEEIQALQDAISIAKARMNSATTQEEINDAHSYLENKITIFNTSRAPIPKEETYDVPVFFYSALSDNPIPMATDTLITPAKLVVNGDDKKLIIELIPSVEMGGAYITNLSKSKDDMTPIGEAEMVTMPDGNERPSKYTIDVKDLDLEALQYINVGISADKMPVKVNARIRVNFHEKTNTSSSGSVTPSVDKSSLREAIKKYTDGTFDFTKYTEESRKDFKTVLEKALEVLENDDAKETDVSSAITALQEAETKLIEKKVPTPVPKIVDKKDLIQLITQAESKTKENYTEDSYKNLENALKNAKKIRDDVDSTETQVTNAKVNLQNAINSLQEKKTPPSPKIVDKKDLRELIKKANGISTSAYTDDSVKKFREALTNARTVEKDDNATETQVNEVKTALENAITSLKKKVDKSYLERLIQESDKIDYRDYEDDSRLREFKDALSRAKDVYFDKETSQDKVDAISKDLSYAKSNLNPKKRGYKLYKVPVYVEKLTGGESMANKIINSEAIVEEKDGRYTYTVQFGKLTFKGKTAGVDTLYIYDGSTSIASKGKNDTFTWTSNSKVSSQRVGFDVSAMPSTQDAYLVFSWDSAVEVSGSTDDHFRHEAPNRKIETPTVDKKDKENKKEKQDNKKNENKIENKIENKNENKLIKKDNNKAIISKETFTDTKTHWAKNSIDYVVEKGYFVGTSAKSFSPNKPITRGEFVTVLGRMLGVNTNDYKNNNFKDVKSTDFYAPFVSWAEKTGITKGVGKSKFAPNRPITRQEMAVMIVKFLEISGKDFKKDANTKFNDKEKIASWAKNAVDELAKMGIINGNDKANFDPNSKLSRAQVAQVLYNIDHK